MSTAAYGLCLRLCARMAREGSRRGTRAHFKTNPANQAPMYTCIFMDSYDVPPECLRLDPVMEESALRAINNKMVTFNVLLKGKVSAAPIIRVVLVAVAVVVVSVCLLARVGVSLWCVLEGTAAADNPSHRARRDGAAAGQPSAGCRAMEHEFQVSLCAPFALCFVCEWLCSPPTHQSGVGKG